MIRLQGWKLLAVALVVLAAVAFLALPGLSQTGHATGTIKVGFVGALTGPVAKYGAFEAVRLAVDEINADGGINGTPIELIAEDGKCNANDAITSATKLIKADGVKVILGGHCSPESIAMSPIAQENKVVMLASISTSPAFKGNDYAFRTSPSSEMQAPPLAKYLRKANVSRLAIIYEQTSYAAPIAESLKSEFEKAGGTVSSYDAFAPGTTDYHTIVARAKASNPDAVFISPQSPDAVYGLFKQLKESGVNALLAGNDITANTAAFASDPSLQDGLIYSGSAYNYDAPKTKAFAQAYKKAYGTDVPYGLYTAESYDAVYIIAQAIREKGYDADAIANYLSNLQGFEGASGNINIDEQGNRVREYVVLVMRDGKPQLA